MIAVTSANDRATRRKAELSGFNAFVPKPLNIEELLTTVQKLTGRKGAKNASPEYFGMMYTHADPCRITAHTA